MSLDDLLLKRYDNNTDQPDDEAHELNQKRGFDSGDDLKEKQKITSQSNTTKLQRPGDSVITWL